MRTWRPISLLVLTLFPSSGFVPDVVAQDRVTLPASYEATSALRIPNASHDVALDYFSDLALVSDTILVPQPRSGRILAIGADGVGNRVWAEAGRGPGEFTRPARIGHRGDTLWIADNALRRLTLFVGTNVARTETLPASLPAWPEAILDDGSTLVRVREAGPPGSAHLAIYARLRGAALDTMVVLNRDRSTFVVENGRAGSQTLRQPFSDAPLFDISVDGRRVAIVDRRTDGGTRGGVATLTVLSGKGDTIFARDLPYQPVPIPSQKVEEWVDLYTSILIRAGRGREDARAAILEGLFVPSGYPHVSRLVAGRDGTVLLQLEPAGSLTPTLIFDATGAAQRIVHLPTDFIPREADIEHVWGQAIDELEIPYLVRYDLAPGVVE